MEIRIDRLLRAYVEVGDITVRALSELDVRNRMQVASHESRLEADELEDESSERHRELIASPILEMTPDVMLAAIVALETQEYQRDAEREFPFDYIPFPDSATLEERHETLRAREDHERKVATERLKYVTKRGEAFRKKAEGWDEEALIREVKRRTITNFVLAKYAEVYQNQTLVLACRRNGKRLFKSWDEVPKYGARALERLFAAYREVDSMDPWEIEKNALTEPMQDGSEPQDSPRP